MRFTYCVLTNVTTKLFDTHAFHTLCPHHCHRFIVGLIETNGGACTSTGGGSGAGGMIAFHYKTAQLGGIISSYGGTGTVPGAAGSVYQYQTEPTAYRKVSIRATYSVLSPHPPRALLPTKS